MVKRRPRNAPKLKHKAYWEWLGDACVVTGRSGTVVHHILANAPGKIGRRDHMLVVRLIPELHNMGPQSIHMLGSEVRFLEVHGVDLVAIAVANRDSYLGS